MSIEWIFPLANHGAENGGNDSGIYTFAGDKFGHLGKEVGQNSMDAQDGDKKVIIEFKSYTRETSKMPGYSELKTIMTKCYEEAKENNSPKIRDSFEKSLNILNEETIEVLQISDSNTLGLSDPENNTKKGSFNALVKANGKSNKPSNAGGSFGIGKNVVYTVSDLKTVYFSSLNKEDQFGFQGCSKLISYPEGGQGDYTNGTGFYGNPSKCLPITKKEDIPSLLRRDKAGTDIYVYGFSKQENWEEKLKKSIIENFFISLIQDKLCVIINGYEINKETLSEIIEKEYSEEHLLYQYYKAYTEDVSLDNVKEINKDYIYKGKNYGKICLRLIKHDNFSNKVSIVRNNGMKICNKSYRSISRFAGVLYIEGEELNEYIKMMENPEHDKLIPDLVENFKGQDPKHAKGLLKDLYENFIKKEFRDLIGSYDVEKIEVQSIGGLLPSVLSKNMKLDVTKESVRKKPKKIKIKKRKSKPEEQEIQFEKPGSSGSSGVPTSSGSENKARKKPKLISRVIYLNDSKFRALINGSSSKEGYISFNILSEDGNTDKCKISNIKLINGNEKSKTAKLCNNDISYGPVVLGSEENMILEFDLLEDQGKYSLEVNFNEINK